MKVYLPIDTDKGVSIANKFFKEFVKLEGNVVPPKKGMTLAECKFFIDFAEALGDLDWIAMEYPTIDGGRDEFQIIIGGETSDPNITLRLSDEEREFVDALLN